MYNQDFIWNLIFFFFFFEVGGGGGGGGLGRGNTVEVFSKSILFIFGMFFDGNVSSWLGGHTISPHPR